MKMKVSFWKIAFVILIISSSYSCTKSYFVDADFQQAKIVMNGIIDPDYGLWLNLTESMPVNRSTNLSLIPITNATVNYYENDILITGLTHDNNGHYYETDFKPQAGNKYKITVDANRFTSAETTVTIPQIVEITDHDFSVETKTYSEFWGTYTRTDFYIDISFTDPDTLGNYYMLSAYQYENGSYQPIDLASEDDDMNIFINDGLNILAMEDVGFNGETKDYTVSIQMNRESGFEARILIELSSLEESYYRYLRTYSQNFTGMNSDDGPLITEVVQVHSNIKSGLGIMAAISQDYFAIDYTYP